MNLLHLDHWECEVGILSHIHEIKQCDERSDETNHSALATAHDGFLEIKHVQGELLKDLCLRIGEFMNQLQSSHICLLQFD